MRPGRLDRILYVGPPDRAGREEILRIRMKSMQTGPEVDVAAIAELVSPTARFSHIVLAF
jgi:AAA family ATPase